MTLLAIVLGIASVLPIPAELPKEMPEAARKELQALQGKWRVVKFLHSDRETTPGTDGDDVIVEFKGSTIDFNKAATGVVVDLDPATDPKCLDFKTPTGSGVFKNGTTYESVYKLDGDTLTWAVYHGREKNRPTDFDKPTDPKVMVVLLTRVGE
jgi:uncharacterized protein (TIGR03067 family)